MDRIKLQDRKLKIALTVVVIVTILLVFAVSRINPAWTFWFSGISGEEVTTVGGVLIGEWDMEIDEIPVEPPVANFDEMFEAIRQRDAHIFYGYRHIHILGHNLSVDSPIIPINIEVYDVLVFKLESTIYAIQVVGEILPAVLSSWENLAAGISNVNVRLNTGDSNFTVGNVYTRAHGPVNYGGRQWLARHDNVASIPHVGNDWFLIANNWTEQVYPVGSIVRHGNQHFRKIAPTSGVVNPTSEAGEGIWMEIPYLSRELFNVPLWVDADVWYLNDVVNHHGFHYVSLIDYNFDIPGTTSNWHLFYEFDPLETVPWHNEGIGRPWQNGDFVRATVGEQVSYFFREGAGGNAPASIFPDGWAWQSVADWHDLIGVAPWNNALRGTTGNTGVIVEYNGNIFRLMGTWIPDATPPNGAAHWERILRWEETQTPAAWGPANWPRGSLVTQNEQYFITVEEMGTWYNPADLNTSPRVRRINPWDESQIYIPFANLTWGGGIAHAYTIENDEMIFWEFIGTGPISGERPGLSPMWQQFEFLTTQNIVITEIAGRLAIWDRAASAVNELAPGAPSITNPNWVRRLMPVQNLFAFTKNGNGLTTLWRNNMTAGNISQPGTDASWTQIYFPTGRHYVSTVNEVGIYQFWYSPMQSNTPPSPVSPHWQMLRYELFSEVPNFFYMEASGGQVVYFEVNPRSAWQQVKNAWIGGNEVAAITGGNTMINHWLPQNSFVDFEIVVYEDTLTNTFRYFRLRDNVDVTFASGISPFSPEGNLFWQPIR